jgi:DNA-binding NtrC family response regulator
VRRVAILGAAGTGKSRLLRELAFRAKVSAFAVASVVCRDDEGSSEPMDRIAAQLDSDAAGLVDRIAEKGRTLLVIDDAERAADEVWQWIWDISDAASSRGAKVLVALGIGEEMLTARARQRLALLVTSKHLQEVRLGALDAAHVEQMLISLFGKGPLAGSTASEIVAAAGGNPLLVEELVRAMVEDGRIRTTGSGFQLAEELGASSMETGARLLELVRRRISTLPKDAKVVLQAIAALGGRAPTGVIAAAFGIVDEAFYVSLLADRGLVTLRAGDVETTNDAVIDAALMLAEADERRHLGEKACAWLDAHGSDPIKLARAQRLAGDVRGAFQHSLSAARNARAIGEGTRTARLAEDAISLAEAARASNDEIAEAWRLLAEGQRSLERPEQALASLRNAFERSSADSRERVRVATLAVEAALTLEQGDAAGMWLGRAKDAAVPGDALCAAWIARASGFVERSLRRTRRACEEFTRAIEIIEAHDDDAESRALHVALLCDAASAVAHHDRTQAVEMARRALGAAELAGDRFSVVRATNTLAASLTRGGEVVQAKRLWENGAAICRAIGTVHMTIVYLTNLSEVRQLSGDVQGGREALDLATALAEAAGEHVSRAQVAETMFHWRNADFRAVDRLTQTALGSRAIWQNSLEASVAACAAAASQGHADRAREIASQTQREAETGDTAQHQVEGKATAAYAHAAASPAEGAKALEATAEQYYDECFQEYAPYLMRDAALSFARAANIVDANRALDRAAQMLEQMGCPLAAKRMHGVRAMFPRFARGGRTSGIARVRVDTLEQLGAALVEIAHRAGSPRDLRVFVTAGAALKEVGTDNEVEQDGALRAAALRALTMGDATSADGMCLIPVRVDDLALCIAARIEDAVLLAWVEELAQTSLELLAMRRRRTSTPAESKAELTSAATSRLAELTVGTVSLRHTFPGIVAKSSGMLRALSLVDKLADHDVPVLVMGETGTGKEVLAQALHAASARREGPMVAVNMGAVPGPLFEAELFGYVRGAFTGAARDHAGYVREAAGGTLFLDEVGELSLDLQPKLLRLLQEQKFRPVGGTKDEKADVRIIAATNLDLAKQVEQGRFREDLYYRLDVVEVKLPPLRERAEDIPDLVRHLLAKIGAAETAVSARAMSRLAAYRWPGNVRELENEVRRALVVAGGASIDERHLSRNVRRALVDRASSGTLVERRTAFEDQVILETLRETQGNQSQAARRLGISRQYLVKRLGLLRASDRAAKKRQA